MQFPSCFANSQAQGGKWVALNEWSCSDKTYSPNRKIKGG
jgi:hypothetical protein